MWISTRSRDGRTRPLERVAGLLDHGAASIEAVPLVDRNSILGKIEASMQESDFLSDAVSETSLLSAKG